MKSLRSKKYLHVTRKGFDPISLGVSIFALIAVIAVSLGVGDRKTFFDLRSLFVVVVGTFASTIFQFDMLTLLNSFKLIAQSFLRTPEQKVNRILRHLDDAIIHDRRLDELREGSQINGDILNDIVFMHKQGLLFEEIDEFVTSRIKDEYLNRDIAVNLLQRAAIAGPAFGLLGTVIGLVGVLKSLSNPTQIGPSMALALMTTAYGAALGTVVFTPLAGRLEHHNQIYLEVHKQLLSKVGILLARRDRKLDELRIPESREVA